MGLISAYRNGSATHGAVTMSLTISNQKALKSRLSTGWAHDSRQYFFERTHSGPAFEDEAKGVTWTEAFAWFAAFVGLTVFLVFVLGLA
jgi:hypothetical protein